MDRQPAPARIEGTVMVIDAYWPWPADTGRRAWLLPTGRLSAGPSRKGSPQTRSSWCTFPWSKSRRSGYRHDVPSSRTGEGDAQPGGHDPAPGGAAMLDGVVPFPADFAARYRAAGYWQDRPLIDGFRDVFQRFATRIAVVDGTDEITYGQVDERSTQLARALLDRGIRPLDRMVVQLPNVAGFVYLYLALQKVGAIPILALPGHRAGRSTSSPGSRTRSLWPYRPRPE